MIPRVRTLPIPGESVFERVEVFHMGAWIFAGRALVNDQLDAQRVAMRRLTEWAEEDAKTDFKVTEVIAKAQREHLEQLAANRKAVS